MFVEKKLIQYSLVKFIHHHQCLMYILIVFPENKNFLLNQNNIDVSYIWFLKKFSDKKIILYTVPKV
jgi:hypothetical protein